MKSGELDSEKSDFFSRISEYFLYQLHVKIWILIFFEFENQFWKFGIQEEGQVTLISPSDEEDLANLTLRGDEDNMKM